MKTFVIDRDQLDVVRGGFLPLLGLIGPVLSGVSGIIGAAKAGKGGGGAAAASAAPAGGGGGEYVAGAGAYAYGPAPRPPIDGGVDVSVQVAHGVAAEQAMRGLT